MTYTGPERRSNEENQRNLFLVEVQPVYVETYRRARVLGMTSVDAQFVKAIIAGDTQMLGAFTKYKDRFVEVVIEKTNAALKKHSPK